MAQRISLAQEQLKLATSNPTMHNMYEAYRRMYAALGVDNIEQVLPPPPQPQPEDPMSENAQAVLATGGTKQLRACQSKTMMHTYLHMLCICLV